MAAWGKGEEATLSALDDLLRHRLIAEGVGADGADYAFTHHKIQEVVYTGLPRHRRLRLHGQVGLALERCLGAGAGGRAAELALHFEQARQLDAALTDKAVAYLLQAGQQAERQSAHREAISYFQRGLDILHALPETSQRLQQEVELQIALAVPTTVIYGYASPETRHVYDQARALCRQAGDAPALFAALSGLSRYYGMSGDIKAGFELAKQMYDIAQAAQDSALQLEAYRAIAGNLFGLGRLKEAQAFWERGVALYDLGQHERQAYRFGHDPAIAFHGYLSLTLWLLGYPDQALAESQRLSRLNRSFTHPTSLALAHCWLAKSACAYRDPRTVQCAAEQAIRVSEAHGLANWTAMATVLRGWALTEQGQAAEGLAQLSEGIAVWRAMGWAHFTPYFLALQAEACLQAGKLSDGDGRHRCRRGHR